jgi:hypothetical protein
MLVPVIACLVCVSQGDDASTIAGETIAQKEPTTWHKKRVTTVAEASARLILLPVGRMRFTLIPARCQRKRHRF